MPKLTSFARYTWAVLAYNLFVIGFGAFVRASGSGAGCGAHWPLCNGVIIPRPERIETIIEFTHRITSGLTLVLVLVLLIWAWRIYPKGSKIRTSAALVVFFTLTEALVGAGLVLFELVAHNASLARAFSMMVHLVNTFILVAMLTLTGWWATMGEPQHTAWRDRWGLLLLLGALGILLLGASGAVTALGDTLFPAGSLTEGIAQDFEATAHWLVRMRIYHPGIAASIGIYLFLVTQAARRRFSRLARVDTLGYTLFGLYALQLILGITNVALLAPIWMQIIHLLVSNFIWIVYITLLTTVMGRPLALDAAARTGDHEVHDAVRQRA